MSDDAGRPFYRENDLEYAVVLGGRRAGVVRRRRERWGGAGEVVKIMGMWCVRAVPGSQKWLIDGPDAASNQSEV
jgi:hypothetical protein